MSAMRKAYTDLVNAVKKKRVKRDHPYEREADLQKKMVKLFEWNGFEVVRFNSGVSMENGGKRRYLAFYRWYGRIGSIEGRPRSSGIPDLFVFGKGVAFFVEVKTLKGEMRESQKDFARAIEGCVPTFVCRSLEEAEALIAPGRLPVQIGSSGVQGLEDQPDGWRGGRLDGDGGEGQDNAGADV